MVQYLLVHLNGLLVDISKAYELIVRLEWTALRQSNAKFDLSFEAYQELERRIRPLVVGEGNDFWFKFWRHVLVELGVHPVPSVVEGLLEKFRVFFVNSCELYPDVVDFLNLANSKGFRVVLVESGSKPLVDRTLQKFDLRKFFFDVIIVPGVFRSSPEFFDSAVEKLGVSDESVCVLCSRMDKDFKSSSDFNRVLVTRRFYERVNRRLPDVFARNLLQVFDLLPAGEDVVRVDDFYSGVIDELNS